MDKILICDLRVNAHIGVTAEERSRRQSLLINVEIGLDLQPASKSDDLTQSVDYAELEERIVSLVDHSNFQLLERLGGAIGELVLEYPLVQTVLVRIEKPRAAKHARVLAVELNFNR